MLTYGFISTRKDNLNITLFCLEGQEAALHLTWQIYSNILLFILNVFAGDVGKRFFLNYVRTIFVILRELKKIQNGFIPYLFSNHVFNLWKILF